MLVYAFRQNIFLLFHVLQHPAPPRSLWRRSSHSYILHKQPLFDGGCGNDPAIFICSSFCAYIDHIATNSRGGEAAWFFFYVSPELDLAFMRHRAFVLIWSFSVWCTVRDIDSTKLKPTPFSTRTVWTAGCRSFLLRKKTVCGGRLGHYESGLQDCVIRSYISSLGYSEAFSSHDRRYFEWKSWSYVLIF